MDKDEPPEVIRRLFTMAGTRAEAVARTAGDGQVADLTADQARRLGHDLVLAAQDLAVLGDAIVLLADKV